MNQVILGNLELALEKSYAISQHENSSQITQTDYLNAIRHVHVDREVRDALNRIDVRDELPKLNTWTVTGKGVYVGAWSKRLSKFIYKTHHIKLDPQVVSIITERVMRTLDGTHEDFLFEFSTILWEPGQFGEKDNSCWFGARQYGYCSTGLINSGQGGAIKIYDVSGFKRARCWFYNLEGSLLLFNAYDVQKKLDILSISRMISIRFGMDYHKHPEIIADDAYINGKSVYAIGNPPISRPVTLDFALRAHRSVPVLYDEGLRILGNKHCPNCDTETSTLYATNNGQGCRRCTLECNDCHQRIRLADAYSTWDGNSVCSVCFDNYEECGDCGEMHLRSDVECPSCISRSDNDDTFYCSHCEEMCEGDSTTLADGNVVCQSCRDDHYSYCDECDEFYHQDDTNYVQSADRVVCDECLSNRYAECSHCHEYFRSNAMYSVEDDYLCMGCKDEHAVECEHCDSLVYLGNANLVTTDDDDHSESWCESCVDEHATYCETCSQYYADDVAHLHEEEADDENQGSN